MTVQQKQQRSLLIGKVDHLLGTPVRQLRLAQELCDLHDYGHGHGFAKRVADVVSQGDRPVPDLAGVLGLSHGPLRQGLVGMGGHAGVHSGNPGGGAMLVHVVGRDGLAQVPGGDPKITGIVVGDAPRHLGFHKIGGLVEALGHVFELGSGLLALVDVRQGQVVNPRGGGRGSGPASS